MNQSDYDVSIVGYGPVGAFAALLLAREGLRVSIHERSTKLFELPRAVGLDGESVRSFQRIGLGDEVDAIVQAPREADALWFTNSRREKLFGMDFPRTPGHNGWRDMCFFDQPELEAKLREWVAEESRIDVFEGEEAVAIDPSDECVRLDLKERDSDVTREVTCSYLLGCDGASSFIRQQSEIEWTSLGYDQDWLVIDVLMKPTADLPPVMMQVCDPERLVTYVCVKDPNRRWEIQLLEGETREEMLRPERIRTLLDTWVEADQYEIRRAAVYQFHAATAERWRSGRVLLAGDSAHQTPPFLGQGLNSGFRDAVNLGWKIPLVLDGTCSDRLLDSYFDERNAHAHDLVEWAVGIGKLMETLAAREAGRPDPYPATGPPGGLGQGRTAPPLRSGVLILEQVAPDAPVGELLCQPLVRKSGGATMRFDELLGSGFAIVGRSADDIMLGREAEALASQLSIGRVGLEGVEPVDGELDGLFEQHPAVLVRPDRYIFGVVDADHTLDSLVTALGERLALL